MRQRLNDEIRSWFDDTVWKIALEDCSGSPSDVHVKAVDQTLRILVDQLIGARYSAERLTKKEISLDNLRRLAEYRIELLEEHEEIPEDFPIEEIQNRLRKGDLWAWCCVKVTAWYAGIEGADFLGGCSYEDETDFKQGGYWEDMRIEALGELHVELMEIDKALERLR